MKTRQKVVEKLKFVGSEEACCHLSASLWPRLEIMTYRQEVAAFNNGCATR